MLISWNLGETPNATRLREDMVLGIQASSLYKNIQRTAIQQRDAAGVNNRKRGHFAGSMQGLTHRFSYCMNSAPGY